jgi:CRP/FNR family transcriptional regulator, anaerobic regulatory protein
MEELLQLLRSVGRISPALEKHLRKIIKVRYYKKREILLQSGEVASLILYLKKGLVRSYSLRGKKQVSNWFMAEGRIIISVESFLQQIPAEEVIHALEDCECWGITYAELEKTYRKFPSFERIGRLITGSYYCLSEARHNSQRQRFKEEKYEYMMATQPELVARVQVNYMASYLDISRSSYTSLRSDYAKGKRFKRR